jgi:hypothetical protein
MRKARSMEAKRYRTDVENHSDFFSLSDTAPLQNLVGLRRMICRASVNFVYRVVMRFG